MLLVTVEGALFRLETSAVTAWHRFWRRRPPSFPYITGDGFRSWCDLEFNPLGVDRFAPQDVPGGALIYCRGDHLRTFLETPAKAITVPFSILTNNDDTTITPEWRELFPALMQSLMAQNLLVDDPRVVALPIGLENAALHYNGVVRDFDALRRRSKPTMNRILVAFTDGTNPRVRGPARSALIQNRLADLPARTNSRSYRKAAVHYRFVASPPGNGVDCHRTWEALYLRSVPIVVRSVMTERFASLGLPLWLVENYEELTGLTEGDLEKKYQELSPGFDHPALWMDYWGEIVRSRSLGRDLKIPPRRLMS